MPRPQQHRHHTPRRQLPRRQRRHLPRRSPRLRRAPRLRCGLRRRLRCGLRKKVRRLPLHRLTVPKHSPRRRRPHLPRRLPRYHRLMAPKHCLRLRQHRLRQLRKHNLCLREPVRVPDQLRTVLRRMPRPQPNLTPPLRLRMDREDRPDGLGPAALLLR
jgi:hypothetical protein